MMIYNEKISDSLVYYSIKFLNEIFLTITPKVYEPSNFFYFPTPNSNIKVSNEKLMWSFAKGISIAIWFYLEDVISNQKNESNFKINRL